jgi:hypothetical protein
MPRSNISTFDKQRHPYLVTTAVGTTEIFIKLCVNCVGRLVYILIGSRENRSTMRPCWIRYRNETVPPDISNYSHVDRAVHGTC